MVGDGGQTSLGALHQLVQRRTELPAQDLRLLIGSTWRDRSVSVETIAAVVPLIILFRCCRNQ